MSEDKYINARKQSNDIFSKVQEFQLNSGVAPTAELDKLRQQYIERAQRRIDMYRDNEHEHMQEVMREIDDKRIKQLQRIQMAFDSNSDKWIEEIFENIISKN